jgi:hypothetical protein
MDDGDSIVISARVFACIEAIDCAPVHFIFSPIFLKNINRSFNSISFIQIRRCAETIVAKGLVVGKEAVAVGTRLVSLIPNRLTAQVKLVKFSSSSLSSRMGRSRPHHLDI